MNRAHGRDLGGLDYDMPDIPHRGGIEATERIGRRAMLHYYAAEDGVDPVAMVQWADTEKDRV